MKQIKRNFLEGESPALSPFGLLFIFKIKLSDSKPKVITSRSNHRRCSVKKDVLRNFTKFTGKHLYHSLFFNKVAGRKATLAQVFFCEFCEISINTFFTEHLWATASVQVVMKFGTLKIQLENTNSSWKNNI